MDGDGANEDEGLGIDVILQQDGDKKAPSCLHGPALLFEKVCRGEEKGRRFYACSACRDRKDCNFFQWEDEKVSEARLQAREMEKQSKRPKFTHKEYCSRLKRFASQPAGERMFCQDCQMLLLPSERDAHASHRSVEVNAAQLTRPSALLRPLENKKSNAQYLFTDRSTNFLLATLAGLGYRRVLCVGTPRLHELIKLRKQEKKDEPMKSLLLDIDLRYAQFYGEDEFCHYNMFNHHFFGGEACSQVLQAFLSESDGEKVVMVADPPFGGLVNPLAHSFSLISQAWRKLQSPDSGSSGDMPMVWVFPYFFEPRILQCLPSLTMLDYQVDYDNHPLYKHGKTGRKQSPVRMFTNLSPRAIVLPAKEGYRFCTICERYVWSLNKHCAKCNVCPSKDGREWRHCTVCEKCVKPSWKHCQKCGHCALPGHPCGQENKEGCFVCGSLKHRRNACKQRLAQRVNKANARGGKKLLPPRPAFKPAGLKAGKKAGKRKSGASRRAKKLAAAAPTL